MKLSIIGGDYRTVKLIQLLAEDKNEITVYGFEECKELYNIKNIVLENDIEKAISDSDIIIGPVPMTKNKKYIVNEYSDKKITIEELIDKVSHKLLICGSIPDSIRLKENFVDVLKYEELTILNAISTAEGTIEIVMNNTQKTLFNSNVLVIGYGRIGKILTDRLQGFKANVYCSARGKDLTWIKSFGINNVSYDEFDKKLNMFDIIINTVPVMILNEERLRLIKKDALLVDVASSPGGIDFSKAKELKINTLWELGIPGRKTPVSAAEYLRDAIYKIVRNRGENK